MHSRSTTFLVSTVAATILFAVSSYVGAGEKIADAACGFTMILPDGFVPNADLAAAAPDIVHAFVLGDQTDDELDILLFIEKMRGVIGRERLKMEDMPPGFPGRLFTTRWQGFDIDAFEVPEQVGEIETITYNVQIPLRGAAIQVKLFGAAAREAELKLLLTKILANLKGDSNWIPSAAPFAPVASSRNYGLILLVILVSLILGGLLVLWFISRIAPKGAVLLIAIVIYGAGLTLADIRVREARMLTGAFKMLGIAGGMLGFVDLVRKRKPQDDSAE